MHTSPRLIRNAFWIVLGIAALSVSLGLYRTGVVAQAITATPASVTATAAPALDPRQDVGSTDGIVLMSAIIVLIVVIPILLRRRTWSGGGRRKTGSGSRNSGADPS